MRDFTGIVPPCRVVGPVQDVYLERSRRYVAVRETAPRPVSRIAGVAPRQGRRGDCDGLAAEPCGGLVSRSCWWRGGAGTGTVRSGPSTYVVGAFLVDFGTSWSRSSPSGGCPRSRSYTPAHACATAECCCSPGCTQPAAPLHSPCLLLPQWMPKVIPTGAGMLA